MRNTLEDLNNQLFEQLERLNSKNLKGDALREEIQRSSAVTQIAEQIISNGTLVMRALTLQTDILPDDKHMPKMLHQKEHDETKFQDQIIREFTCKHCGKRVLISDTDDRRIVFCCVNCERRYWKHPERASHRGSNNGMSGGMSLNNLKLREARDLD